MTDKIFKLIKEHNYNKLIEFINKNDNIDLNISDNTNTYLINYVILFNNIEILNILINKKCKLDILDSDGRNIFYIPIKYSYYNIINILLKESNNVIGIPLLELQDKYGNIPLHYTIIFNNYELFELLLNYSNNINFKNNEGDTILQMLTRNISDNKYYLIQKIIDKKININSKNNNGLNALHIAIELNKYNISKCLLDNNIDVNIETDKMHNTPLIISVLNNNINISKLLLNYNVNINTQDIYGNTILNYAIINKYLDFIELYHNKIDVNLINIQGQSAIYLFFNNKYDMDKLDNYYFDKILIKSNINIQDIEGNTLWHYLIYYDIWERYIDILINKKNKIFIINKKNESPYDLILKSNKYNNFIDLISNSFYNILKLDKDNIYKVNFDYTKISKEESLLKIRNIIINKHISSPIKNKTFIIKNLYPKSSSKHQYTYTGLTIDIISGLLYLKKKFNNISTSLTKNFIYNELLQKYYNSLGIVKDNDFINFEIIWSHLKLFYPTNFKDILTNNNYEYLVIPLGVELSNGSHANILLYDRLKNELERFEPHGNTYPAGFNYYPNILDSQIKNLFLTYITEKDFKYFTPSNYEIKIGFQVLDILEYEYYKNITMTDPNGFCAAWCIWYIDMRLSYINIPRNEIIVKLINNIRIKNISFRTTIRNYTKKITNIRDFILKKNNLDINKWLYDNYTIKEWNDVSNTIIELI